MFLFVLVIHNYTQKAVENLLRNMSFCIKIILLCIEWRNSMSVLTFKGGVHPIEGKELSKAIAVRKIQPDG